MTIALRYAAYSDVGHIRGGNEDSGYAGPYLLAVADGMGGYEGGEIASSIAVSALQPHDGDTLGSEMVEVLKDALDQANNSIAQQVIDNPRLENMGTTVTAMLWSGARFALIHVGDSRAYLLRNGELSQITHDHTLVQTLVDENKITKEEAETHPQRSLILRALNGQGKVDPDTKVVEAELGDRFLLCSDGLSGVVSDDTIQETLRSEPNLDAAARRLIDLANRGGGPDNITAVIADVIDTAADEPSVAPVVVGAADQRREPPMIPDTPAGRAQGLTSKSGDTAEMDAIPADPGPPLSEEPEFRTRRWWPMVLIFLLIVGVLAAAAFYFGRQWLDGQYFIGPDETETNVAVYRGINAEVFGLSFADEVDTTDIALDQLPPSDRDGVEQTISVGDQAEADALVEDLRVRAGEPEDEDEAAGDDEPEGEDAQDQDEQVDSPAQQEEG